MKANPDSIKKDNVSDCNTRKPKCKFCGASNDSLDWFSWKGTKVVACKECQEKENGVLIRK